MHIVIAKNLVLVAATAAAPATANLPKF